MDLTQIKMVVSDMDGTLLNSRHEVSSRFLEVFNKLRSRDILFVAASGRQYKSMEEKLFSIKDEVLFISENGALVVHKNEELLSTPLDSNTVNELLRPIQNINNSFPVLCSKTKAFIGNVPDPIRRILNEYYTEYEELDDLYAYDEPILKIAIYHGENSEQYIYPAVKHWENQLKIKVSGLHWVDISHQNAHKGFALQKVQDLYNIKPSQTMVFGDYNNDLEMIGLSHFSYAMANAHTEVLAAAKFSTTSNDEFGVERVLEELLSPKGS